MRIEVHNALLCCQYGGQVPNLGSDFQRRRLPERKSPCLQRSSPSPGVRAGLFNTLSLQELIIGRTLSQMIRPPYCQFALHKIEHISDYI